MGEEYFIEDNKSTFGTLVQVQYPVFLSAELFCKQPMVLQSGKTLMSIHCKIDRIQKGCFSCFQPSPKREKLVKRSNKGLATFDKINYFPLNFVQQASEKREKDKKLKFQKPRVQAIEEDDVVPDEMPQEPT